MNATTIEEGLSLTLQERPEAPVAVVEPTRLPAAARPTTDLVAAALDRGASLEVIDYLLKHAAEERRLAAVNAYNEAFAAFKSEVVEVMKAKRVRFETSKGITEYDHAELSDVVEAVTPGLSRHGLSASWKITEQRVDWIQVTCFLKHVGGHSESVYMGGPPDASGGKNTIQAIASAKTYLERYTLKAICGIAEKGKDDDGRGGIGDIGDTSTKPSDKLLIAFQAVASLGEAALRRYYSENVPPEEFWQQHSRALKAAAKAVDGKDTR